MEKLKMQSHDVIGSNIEKIAKLFPNCVTEVLDNQTGGVKLGIDFEKLKAELSLDIIDETEERYQFTWPDKRAAVRLANTPTTMTLRPCREESVDFDNTQNLYIEGDNLDVLKVLRETYLGKVKMIYIDPPYNTGNDFVYNDDFRTENLEWRSESGNYDDDGNLIVDCMTRNTESNGRFHTDWLNMIYPRLKVAKDLLANDGAIFISIGDDEESNLIKICDEIFGEHNFIASICHKHRASVSNDRIISENHNHLVFYARDISVMFANQKLIGEDPKLEGFKYSDERGEYKLTPVDGPGGAKKGNPHYEFLGIEGYWRYSKETMQQKYDAGLIVRTANGLQQKYYLEQAKQTRQTVTTWWDTDFLTSTATKDLASLMGGKYFDNPKSVNLLLRTLRMITKFSSDAIILDFFSGSATTAHAVMKLNAEDGGNRKFIMVQLPELTDEKSEAYKAGYKNICEIGKERIRRAGKKILELSNKNLEDTLLQLERESIIKKYARELSEIRSLEEVYGFGGSSISSNSTLTESGDLCTRGSDAQVGGFNTIEHSGGTIQKRQGVYPVFESGKGLTCGIGNTVVDLRTLEILNQHGYKICDELIRGNQQNDIFSDDTSSVQAVSLELSMEGLELSKESLELSMEGLELSMEGLELSKESLELSNTTNLNSKLSTLSSKLSIPSSKLSTLSSKLSTPSSKLSTPSSKLSTLSSKLSTLSSKLSTPSSKLSTPSSKLSTPSSKLSTPSSKIDTGFRVLKLDSSNMEDVYYTPQEFELQSLFNENVKADRTNEDLLFQVMLDLGIELSAKIESKQIAGKSVHFVDDNYLVACFDRDVNESTITEIAKLQPIYFVMRDASAANDNVIDNFEQIFEAYSKDTVRRIL